MSRDHAEVAARRARIAPGAAVGVGEAMIARLVHAFYADASMSARRRSNAVLRR